MSQPELLKKITQKLRQQKIAYMLTGSLVSSLQGEPRATHDIDIVIAINADDISGLVKAFPLPEYYLDETTVEAAIGFKSMFNLIDANEGDKVDFWILTAEEFDSSRFQRRISETLFGELVAVSSPEDTILAKLRWAELSGGSEKQFIDALRVYEVQYHVLDHKYLEEWVTKLDLTSLWQRIKREGKVI